MKKIFTFFASMLLICGITAQQLELNPSFKPTQENLTTSDAKGESQQEITWLTSETQAITYGNGNTGTTIMPLMEFTAYDIAFIDSQEGRIKSIEKIMFFINSEALTVISGARVVVRQGANITSSNEVVTQTVANVVGGWNTVELSTPYIVDPSQGLYIGYEVSTSAAGYPVSLASGSEAKQAWTKNSTDYINLVADQGHSYVFMIKALATVEELEGPHIQLKSLDVPSAAEIDDDLTVKGVVRNIGTEEMTSFSALYTIDGNTIEENFTGLSVAEGATYEFTFTETYKLDEAKSYSLLVEVSDPNGVEDDAANNSLNAEILVLAELVSKVVLHEGFSSSTCPPCNSGNAKLKGILNAADKSKYANIKYQMNWPSTGDPYYTAEGGVKKSFYGVEGVPDLYVNGKSQGISDYSVDKLNALATANAFIKMTTGNVARNDKTISVDIAVTPLTTPNSDLRIFAAIVEKQTKKNKKTNGESLFYDVMKKFMSSASGDALPTMTVGTPVTISFTYTFNGDYRLPGNANNPINHATEHSVEDFDALKVVYWIQDIKTGEVWQSGIADPNPGWSSIEDYKETTTFSVQPNPATTQFTITSEQNLTQVTLINMLGQVVLDETANGTHHQINVGSLAKGFYLVRIMTEEGVSAQKILIQ
ncbi:T9SS type A sorting domain-containing protein [Bacteroidales bacterium OttesenSCG-928-B11]|nr:T9SS type A sorting domain-containing protein [Bacteroidales bacterium OttesenSCG-928-C03]MDL2312735.1 T9SS type A sorting domain-containing protein [Bacteroidales bacterium OttesenSCG-928-B11]